LYKKLIAWMNQLLKTVIVILFTMMVLVVFLQVVSRYIFESPFSWSEELARYLSIWVTFLGAAVAIGTRNHIQIDVFVNLLPDKLRKYNDLLVDLLQVVFAVIMLVAGGLMLPIVLDNLTPALQISAGYVYASIPVSAVFMALYLGSNIYEDIMEIKGVN